MARRYSRDNRGRFASGGSSSGGGGKVGATARGGRLRTAAGNKRATQTTKAAAAKPSGTVAGKVKRNPAAAGKIGQAKAAKAARFSASETAQRKTRAGQLKAMPKDLRRADRTARLAQREVMATNGAVGGNVIGRRKSSTQSKINSIREGLMRAKGDKTGSIRNQVVKEAKALRARMQTTGAGPRTGAQSGIKRRTARAAAPKNTTANRTGQSKTLNRFNSRPVGTMVAGKGINLVPSTKRVPLQVQRKESDRAFARVATKAARTRAAAPAKAAVRRTEANRTARALANQKRTAQAVAAKGGKRFSPTRKQKKSLSIADAARTFYSAKRVNSLPNFRVNTSKPGFRLPRNMR